MSRIDVVKTEVFTFEELSEEAKQNAIELNAGFNVEYDWWDCTFDDAKNIGLEIEAFDAHRMTISGALSESVYDVCILIAADHDESCDTHKLATGYIEEYAKCKQQFNDSLEVDDDLDFLDSEELEDLEHEFLHDLLQEYLVILKKDTTISQVLRQLLKRL